MPLARYFTITTMNHAETLCRLDSGEEVEGGEVGHTDGMMLMLLQGDAANPMEKMKAAGIAQSIDDERGGKPDRHTYHICDGEANLNEWWNELGSRPPQGTVLFAPRILSPPPPLDSY